MASATTKFYTLAEAAVLAERSKEAVRRWIRDGWIPDTAVFVVPGRNGAWLIERNTFDHLLPGLLEEMSKHTGGRGHYATNAQGYLRGA